MAYLLKHTFQHEGFQYDVYYDTILERVRVQTLNPVLVQTVSVAVLGVPIDHIFTSYCKSTTLVTLRAITNYPFAQVNKEFNSPSCANSPNVCSIRIGSVVAVHESYQGYNDGSIVINVAQHTCNVNDIRFSLDFSNWQTSNKFTGLAAGDYIAYAKCDRTTISAINDYRNPCFNYFNFDINVGPVRQDILLPGGEYPWKEKVCKWFRLVRAGVVYNIREPIKWDQVNIIGKRDKEWHGYNYMYSDGVIDLEFDCAAGKEVIESEYETKGGDGEIFFEYGYTYNSASFILFAGKLNLNTFKRRAGKVSAGIEKKDFNSTFLSRFDSKVSMAGTTTPDGETLTAPSPIEVQLHAKEISRKYQITNQKEETLNDLRYPGTHFLHPATVEHLVSEMEDSFGYPLGFTDLVPNLNDYFNHKVKYDGNYSLLIQYDVDALLNAPFANASYEIKNFLHINNVGTQIGATISGFLQKNVPVLQRISYNKALFTVDLSAGDAIYYYTQIKFIRGTETSAVVCKFTQLFVNVQIIALERAAPSVTKAWWLFDSIDHTIKTITNKASQLKSSFFGRQGTFQATDGEGSLYVTTNGKQIRNFEVEKHPLSIALKELANSVKAIFCVGYGFEVKGSQQFVVFERVNYFYRDKEILAIDGCSDYYEEAAKDLLYNEIETGYNKYQDEGYNTLDEPNTRHEYLSPIKTNKLKLIAKSDLIASGYSIEDQRRKQFDDNPTTGATYDDDGFLISVRKNGPAVLAEKNEAFITVENLISPQTSFNLRITPHRILVNWAMWLRGVFKYKTASDKITNTHVAQNGELITQFKASETRPVGDVNKRLLKESGDYPLSHLFADAEGIYSPDWIHFKTKLTPDKVQLINESLVGARSENTNYGYIAVKDYNGDYQAGFPYETEYNFSTELFSCRMLKKFDSPVNPGATCCNYLSVNGCYVLVNGARVIL